MPQLDEMYSSCGIYITSIQYNSFYVFLLAHCVISPDLTALTITDGLVRDIEFHCQCMDVNGMMISGTRWFLSNGSAGPTQNVNIPPAVLYIASPFDSSDAGTYICSPNSMADNPSRDTITLNTGSEYNYVS